MAEPCWFRNQSRKAEDSVAKSRRKPTPQVLPAGSERWAAAYTKLLLTVCLLEFVLTLEMTSILAPGTYSPSREALGNFFCPGQV